MSCHKTWTEIFRTVNKNIFYMAQFEYTLKIMNLSTFRTTGAKPFHLAQKFSSAYGMVQVLLPWPLPSKAPGSQVRSGFSSHLLQLSPHFCLIKYLSSPKPKAQSGQFHCHRLVQRTYQIKCQGICKINYVLHQWRIPKRIYKDRWKSSKKMWMIIQK